MSVAFESNNSSDSNRIQLQGFSFSHGMWISNLPDSGRFTGGYPRSSTLPAVKEEDDSPTSSSIGNNSDTLSAGADSGDHDAEVQSKDNNSINKRLLNGLSDLEQVLPIKRSISTFYAGKSKSYGSLDDAVTIPSIQDIVKPEDAYSRKRKNMIAHHALLESNGISKRLARNSDHSFNQRASMAGRSLPPLNSRNVQANESSGSSNSFTGVYMSTQSRSFSLSQICSMLRALMGWLIMEAR